MATSPNRGSNDHPASRSIASGQVHIVTGSAAPAHEVRQFAKIGTAPEHNHRVVGLDLNTPNTVLLFGVQGSGKSYLKQLIMESCSLKIPNINELTAPPCVVDFHFTPDPEHRPESLALGFPNDNPGQVESLRSLWRAEPTAVTDIVHLVPPTRLADRKKESGPGVSVLPIEFGVNELSFPDWQVLMGAIADESPYVHVMNLLIEKHMEQGTLSIEGVREDITNSELSPSEKATARIRLQVLQRFVSNSGSLAHLVKPGRLIVVDLRDPNIQPIVAFRLIVVLMRLFGKARLPGGGRCPKLFTLDEFHVYAQDTFLVAELDRSVRLMRHQAVTTIFASQDAGSIPTKILELSTIWGMGQTTSPQHTAYLAKYNDCMSELTTAQLKVLRPGQGYWWARHCSESSLTAAPFLVHFRPSATKPGGATRTNTSQA